MLKKLYDPNNQGIMGPRYEDMFRNAALAVMADPAGGTFIEIPQLFRDPQFLKEKIAHVKDQTVRDFWLKQFPASQRSNEAGEVTAWFVSKFGAFLSNEMMRNIIGQPKSAFDLRDIMDNKKILLVNLSKGRTGDLNSKLLGMIFVMKFQAAAMSRADVPESQRQDFSLYVDEFQNFSTDSFATIMSEARKYHLNLIVANQFTTQLSEEIRDAVFGNMGTIVAFRIGQNDVESLSRYFQPSFDGDDLLRVPNYNSIVRTLIGGVPTQPFSMATLPPLGDPNPKLAGALKQLSAAKHGKPRAQVEKEIFARIAVKEPAPAAPGQRPLGASPWQNPAASAGAGFGPQQPSAFGRPAAPVAPPAPQRSGTGSFMDEWLAKRGAPSTPAGGQIITPTNPTAARPITQPQPTVYAPPAAASSSFASPSPAATPAVPLAAPAASTPALPPHQPRVTAPVETALSSPAKPSLEPIQPPRQEDPVPQEAQEDPKQESEKLEGEEPTGRRKRRRRSKGHKKIIQPADEDVYHEEEGRQDQDGQPRKPVVYGLNNLSSQPLKPEPEIDLSVLKNRPAKTEDELTHGDTIYIDNEGNLKLMGGEQEGKKKDEKEAAVKDN